MSTFVQLQTQVMEDRFPEATRTSVKNFINFRYAWVFDAERWAFTDAEDAVTVTTGSQTVSSLPTDLGPVYAVLRPNGMPLRPMEPAEFHKQYLGMANNPPEAFTVIGGVIYVGPQSDETLSTYKLVYEKRLTILSADGDTPLLPAEYHMLLAHGASADMYRFRNDPHWQDFEQSFSAGFEAMKRKYAIISGPSRRPDAGRVPEPREA